jgi:hypothetical protein
LIDGTTPAGARADARDASRGVPDLEAAAAQLGVSPAAVDAAFGVVPIDPRRGLYSVMVRVDALPGGGEGAEPFPGPYANPEIGPFTPDPPDEA